MFQALMDWLDRLGPRLYAAFLEGDRWRLYLEGLLTTLELTVVAPILGVVLGVLGGGVRAGPAFSAPPCAVTPACRTGRRCPTPYAGWTKRARGPDAKLLYAI